MEPLLGYGGRSFVYCPKGNASFEIQISQNKKWSGGSKMRWFNDTWQKHVLLSKETFAKWFEAIILVRQIQCDMAYLNFKAI